MRPPILKTWRRDAVQFRGIYTNRYGIGSQTGGSSSGGSGGEVEVTEGVNFGFIFDGDSTWFCLKDDFGTNFRLNVVSDAGDNQILVTLESAIIPASAPPPIEEANYHFCSDGYLRFRNLVLGYPNANYIAANVDGSETPVIESSAVNASAILASATYNAGQNFLIVDNKFYFKDALGAVYYPIIIEEALSTYTIQLTSGYV